MAKIMMCQTGITLASKTASDITNTTLKFTNYSDKNFYVNFKL